MQVEKFITDSDRPTNYYYFELLKDYLGGDLSCIFTDKLVYPRQLDIHLPGDGKRGCNFHCLHCQGRYYDQVVDDSWVPLAFSLVKKLNGVIPFIVVGGQYTEPLLSPDLMPLMRLTKKYGSYFGTHTNGSLLMERQGNEGLISEYCELATSPQDYLSCSLDAGFPESHMKSKRLKKNWFDSIIEGMALAAKLRGNKDYPTLRIVYLMNEWNSSPEEIANIVRLSKEIGVDSLRFSIPYDNYNKPFDEVRKYKAAVEVPLRVPKYELIKPYLSKDNNEKPFIFWITPEAQDVDQMRYEYCLFGYFQITFGADGYVYRCSSAASPSMAFNRLGKITDDLDKFRDMVRRNQSPDWKPETCVKNNCRCNRCAVEINNAWRDVYKNGATR